MTEELRYGPYIRKVREAGSFVPPPDKETGEYDFSPDRKLKKRREVAPKELADYLSVTPSYINRVENSFSRPFNLVMNQMIAKLFGCPATALARRATFERDFKIGLGPMIEGPQRLLAVEMMLRLSDSDAEDVKTMLPDKLCEDIIKALPPLVTDELKAKRVREAVKRVSQKKQRDAVVDKKNAARVEKQQAARHLKAVEAGAKAEAVAVQKFTLGAIEQKQREFIAAKIKDVELSRLLKEKKVADWTEDEIEAIIAAADAVGITIGGEPVKRRRDGEDDSSTTDDLPDSPPASTAPNS